MLSCLIRRMPVAPHPEEKVRQALLSFLIHTHSYPSGLIGVEISLASLSHLSGKKVPKRRADIILFAPNSLKPYILIECKGDVPLNDRTIRQVVRYNLFVEAPYLVIANAKELKTGFFNGVDWEFKPGFPTEIIAIVKQI